MLKSSKSSNDARNLLVNCLPSRFAFLIPGVTAPVRCILPLLALLLSALLAQAQLPYQVIKPLGTTGHCLSGFAQDTNGFLYGALYPDNGPGSIFKLRPDGSSYSILHDFTPASNEGSQSASRLVLIGNTLFGTTKSGGSNNLGTVFR